MSKHKALIGFVVEVGPNRLDPHWSTFDVNFVRNPDQAVTEVNFYEALAGAESNELGQRRLLSDYLGEHSAENLEGLDNGDDPHGPLLDQIKEAAIGMLRIDPSKVVDKHFTFCSLNSSDVDVTLKAVVEDDADLDAAELDDKYNPEGDGEHPAYPRAAWRLEVINEDTISGYWDWVVHQIEQEEE